MTPEQSTEMRAIAGDVLASAQAWMKRSLDARDAALLSALQEVSAALADRDSLRAELREVRERLAVLEAKR